MVITLWCDDRRFAVTSVRVTLHEADDRLLTGETMPKSDFLLGTADASRILGVTPAAVRLMHKRGELPATTTAGGMRLFRRADVERLAAKRAARRESGGR